MISYDCIYFLRHLKTRNNGLHIISGQSDSKIINANFLELDLSKFNRIYCSPSRRCVRTIKLLGHQSDAISRVVYDKRLLERDMGDLEGMLKKEGEIKYSELFRRGTFDVFKTPPQGESYECFKSRVKEFYQELLCNQQGNNILICSHNQTLKLLRLFFLGKDITYQSWSEYSFENGKLTKIEHTICSDDELTGKNNTVSVPLDSLIVEKIDNIETNVSNKTVRLSSDLSHQ